MTYRDELLALSAATEAKVVEVFVGWTDGDFTTDEAIALIAAIIAKANNRATVLADVSLAATLMRDLQAPVASLGIGPAPEDPERLRRAAETLLAVGGVTVARAARLGRAEPLKTAARAYSRAMGEHSEVVGWTRIAEPDACEACKSMTGTVLDPDVAMWHHTGCSCTQKPITERI